MILTSWTCKWLLDGIQKLCSYEIMGIPECISGMSFPRYTELLIGEKRANWEGQIFGEQLLGLLSHFMAYRGGDPNY